MEQLHPQSSLASYQSFVPPLSNSDHSAWCGTVSQVEKRYASVIHTWSPSAKWSRSKYHRRIWSLPACSHTRIVHLVANLHSLFNVIFRRSNSLLHAAAYCPAALVQTIFFDSSLSCFSFCGYNNMFGDRHIKQYFVEDHICALVVGSLRLRFISDHICEDMIRTICCD